MIRPGTCTPPKMHSNGRNLGTVTPPLLRSSFGDETLGDSWVDMSQNAALSSSNHSMHTAGIITPPVYAVSEEYLKLLRDAQRESNQSSALVSLASSRRDSLHGSTTFLVIGSGIGAVVRMSNHQIGPGMEIEAFTETGTQHQECQGRQAVIVLQGSPVHVDAYEHTVGVHWRFVWSVAESSQIAVAESSQQVPGDGGADVRHGKGEVSTVFFLSFSSRVE
ncbi:unnamed protein product [Notodromas monacha]|uniref:Uncharacterized protein n=1 Tax=Notodromas monacha TaxID=399045 RepID=A0A7R9BXT2_9CRUS|nr:unnamed protein product [Notodromas monacha]CAG0923775.1 unnamed protein product [Notodromas monacha]